MRVLTYDSFGRMIKFMGRAPFGNLVALLSPVSPTVSFEADICWRVNCPSLEVEMLLFNIFIIFMG